MLGDDPDTGQKIYVMLGRFGPYVQLGETPTDKKADKPRRASLGRNFSEDTITLDDALQVCCRCRANSAPQTTAKRSSPTSAASDPTSSRVDDFRSLAPEDDVYTITLERAKELLAQEKKSMRRQRAAAKELRASSARIRTPARRCASSTAATARTSPTGRPMPRCRRALRRKR